MLTFVPHKINEDYKKVEFYRVNKELCDMDWTQFYANPQFK